MRGVIHTTINRAYGSALRLIMEARAFGALVGDDIVHIHRDRVLGRFRSIAVAHGRRQRAFQAGTIAHAPFSTTLVDRIVGALWFACTAIDALLGDRDGHSVRSIFAPRF